MNNSSTRIVIITLFVLAVLSGYNYFQRPFLKYFENQQVEQNIVVDEPTPITPKEEIILSELSTNEKIWQMISLPVSLDNKEEASVSSEMTFIYENNPGFVTIFGSRINAESVEDFTQALPFSKSGFSPLVAVDHEGGTVQRLSGKGFSDLPSWEAVCSESTGKRRVIFEESAKELRSVGVNIVFAPVIDVPREGSFLKSRACESQLNLLDSAEDYINSFGSQGILSVVKHYPGIGSVTKDLHFYSEEIYTEPQDTAPFERIFTTFPNIGVMTAHVAVAGRTDGLPCSLSEICLDPFPIHFPQAMVFSDALEMKSAITQNEDGEDLSLAETTLLAVLAGNDILVFGEKVSYEELEEVVSLLGKEYDENPAVKETVDYSLRKILDIKIQDEL
jgi:beta-N-acetylhexosaminidase